MKTIFTLSFALTMLLALPLQAQEVDLAVATAGILANINDQLAGSEYYLVSKVEVEKPGWFSSCKQGKTTIFLAKHNSEHKYEYKDCCVVSEDNSVGSLWFLADCDMMVQVTADADYESWSAENGYASIGWPLTQHHQN